MIQENIIERPGQSAGFLSLSEWGIYIFLFSNAFLPAYAVTAFFVLYILYYLITNRFVVPGGLVRYMIIPAILILIGIAGSPGNMLYDILKDGWYYLNPAIILSVGYLVMRRIQKIEDVLKVFVISGFIFALIHLVSVISDFSMVLDATVREIRAEKGHGNFLSMISLSAIFFARKLNIRLFQSRFEKIFILSVVFTSAASLFFSFSRTLWFSLIISLLAVSGLLTLRRLKGVIVVAGMIALFQGLTMFIPKEYKTTDTMMGKITYSIDEVFVSDYVGKRDIQLHWRGYESYMALKTYLDGNVLNLIAGHGFGKLVDLKIYMKLAGEDFRYIPVMHNGYMYLLVKTGVVGLLLYLAYLFIFLKTGIRYAASNDVQLIFAGRFIVSLTLVLFFTTFVISGMFNKGGLVSVIFLLGSLLSYVRIKSLEIQE